MKTGNSEGRLIEGSECIERQSYDTVSKVYGKGREDKRMTAEQCDGKINRTDVKRYIRSGIAAAQWPGRMEILRENPFLMVDGAHNSNGVAALAESLRTLFPGERFHFIMGVMADKDYDRMIDELVPLAIDFQTVTAKSSRALVAEELAACIRAKGISARSCENISEILRPEMGDAAHKTVAFGSLYFIGEIKVAFGYKIVME